MFREIYENEKNYTYTKLDGSINGCQTHSHNTYIQLFTETGVIGTIPIILIFFIATIFLKNYVFNFQKNYNYINNFYFCMIVSVFISLWTFIPTGNFFNNWLNAIYFLPIGFVIYLRYNKNL